MSTRQIDLLNIGLIVVTLAAAFFMPFHLFLFSYAVLGPLHYLTELNWLEERNYFSQSKYTAWIMTGMTFLVCIGPIFYELSRHPFLQPIYSAIYHSFALGFLSFLIKYYLQLIFMAFVMAIALAGFQRWWVRAVIVLLGIAIAWWAGRFQPAALILFSMLPSLLHVGVFTGLFMFYGALKSGSRAGIWAVVLFIAAFVMIAQAPLTYQNYMIGEEAQTRFFASSFDQVIYQFLILVGYLKQGDPFNLITDIGVRMVIVLAFAYTYHYLNWFSKTSIIKWHTVSRRKLYWALGVWVVSMGLYWYNYRLGLMVLLFLSVLHVFLEFPLNYVSVVGIFQSVRSRVTGATG